MRELAESIGSEAPILVADATSGSDVRRVVRDTRVLLTTAGPYASFGTPLVEACANEGTSYVDINGEIGWHHQMIAEHDAAARASGSVLVPSSGFDSIPSDLGTQWMAQRMEDECGQPARRISCFVRVKGDFSGGTVASGIQSDEIYGSTLLSDPFLLGGARPSSACDDEHSDLTTAVFNETIGSHVAPFGMAQINTRIVRRSIGLFEASDPLRAAQRFTPDFCYQEFAVAPSEEVAVKMARATAAPAEKRRALVAAGRLPSPGQGPDEATRGKSWFEFTFVAESADGIHKLVGVVSGGDPGYDETAKMVSEAAVALATSKSVNLAGGFWTPATALGVQLREILHAEGIRFQAAPALDVWT